MIFPSCVVLHSVFFFFLFVFASYVRSFVRSFGRLLFVLVAFCFLVVHTDIQKTTQRQFASEIIESETQGGREKEKKKSTKNENGIKIFMSLCVTGLSFERARSSFYIHFFFACSSFCSILTVHYNFFFVRFY